MNYVILIGGRGGWVGVKMKEGKPKIKRRDMRGGGGVQVKMTE